MARRVVMSVVWCVEREREKETEPRDPHRHAIRASRLIPASPAGMVPCLHAHLSGTVGPFLCLRVGPTCNTLRITPLAGGGGGGAGALTVSGGGASAQPAMARAIVRPMRVVDHAQRGGGMWVRGWQRFGCEG